MERRIEIQESILNKIQGEHSTERQELDSTGLRYMLVSSNLEGRFEVEIEAVESQKSFPRRYIVTLKGDVNYSEVDSILSRNGYSIISAKTIRGTTLEDELGGSK